MKIICVARNYAQHAAEMQAELPYILFEACNGMGSKWGGTFSSLYGAIGV
jgi:2-keto-4-pentenoate hydratase/2-oxohepta-3-ene-1,7-dioic acid hydratase in catechol pathway